MSDAATRRGRLTPREQDERDLAWLRMRRSGMTSNQIADRYDVSRITVKVRTVSIRNEDIALSGEPVRRVNGQYWDSKAMCASGRKIPTVKMKLTAEKR